jgi:general secretion pathway protein G
MLRARLAGLLLLLALAAGSCSTFQKGYEDAALKGREALLRQNLKAMRGVIDQYIIDHGALPQSINDFVQAGYINEIPDDPITEKKDWRPVIGERPNLKQPKGIVDVRSSSTSKSSEGSPYDQW